MDLALHMGAKLSGEWSAASAAGMLSEPVIQYLSGRLDSLEPLARARLLISPLFLRRKELAELAGPLDVLAQTGATDRCACWARRLCCSWLPQFAAFTCIYGCFCSFDCNPFCVCQRQGSCLPACGPAVGPPAHLPAPSPPPPRRRSDEWVRVTAKAVAPYTGTLHTTAMVADSPLVGKTVAELRRLLEGADPGIYRPRQAGVSWVLRWRLAVEFGDVGGSVGSVDAWVGAHGSACIERCLSAGLQLTVGPWGPTAQPASPTSCAVDHTNNCFSLCLSAGGVPQQEPAAAAAGRGRSCRAPPPALPAAADLRSPLSQGRLSQPRRRRRPAPHSAPAAGCPRGRCRGCGVASGRQRQQATLSCWCGHALGAVSPCGAPSTARC